MAKLEDRIEIIENPQQPHCATVLLIDTSGSMAGEKIGALNEGMKLLKEEISKDELASKRLDLAVVTFGESVSVAHEFSSIESFDPVDYVAGGYTPMGEAILKACEMIEQRKQQYKSKGVDYYRPWLFLITDGEPTDMSLGDARWTEVVQRVHDGENGKKFLFFAVAVEPANIDSLKMICPPTRPPVKLKGTKFRELFNWMSSSQSRVSASKVGEQVTLESPVAAGWGEIPV